MKTELQEKGPSTVHCQQREREGFFLTYPINAKPNFLPNLTNNKGKLMIEVECCKTDTYRYIQALCDVDMIC